MRVHDRFPHSYVFNTTRICARVAAIIGQKAPNIDVSEWVQGMPTNIDQEKDQIVLIEVFQVNCPGCFMYAIPEAISIYNKYQNDGVRVFGVATAFEDFDKNTVENLRMLLETGKVVGDTLASLGQYGKLDGDKLSFKIPFPVAADMLQKNDVSSISDERVLEFIHAQLPNFDSETDENKSRTMKQVRDYMGQKEYSASTFEKYQLRGTPSSILVDRQGVLHDVAFGQDAGGSRLESMIQSLIALR